MHANRLAKQIFLLRSERGYSLDQLSALSGLSRASLSRIENADVSPTAESLNRICGAFDMPVSRLMAIVENQFVDFVPFDEQHEMTDRETGVTKRSVSPEAGGLSVQVVEIHMPPNARSIQSEPAKSRCEQHLIVMDGAVEVTLNGVKHGLTAGDCYRLMLDGDLALETPASRGARFLLVTA